MSLIRHKNVLTIACTAAALTAGGHFALAGGQAVPGPTGPAIAATQPSAQSQPATQVARGPRGGRGRGPVPMPLPANPTLGLEQGTLNFDTPDFTLKLVKASQTIAAMEPKG